jgi:uncharacterized damage-inducible protein DinB
MEELLTIIDQAYNKHSWHGTNLQGSLRRVPVEQAAWRPGRGRHNIWEIVMHAAYWKYVVRRRLTGEMRGSFPVKGSNWFQRPQERSEEAWRADVALLNQMHKSMREAIAAFPVKDLHRIPPGAKTSNFTLISGIAAHDLYHAGQIQLLKRLGLPSCIGRASPSPRGRGRN